MDILTRNWGWVVLRGIVAILFGVVTWFSPWTTLAALVLLFGAYALTDGVFAIVWAIANRHGEPHWPALVVGGVLGIAAGVVTFLWPAMTTVLLLMFIAVWAIATGTATIAAAIRLRNEITGEWRLVLAGMLAVTLGVILMAAREVGALAMMLWIGGYAMAAGSLLIALGLRLRSWRQVHATRLVSRPA